MTTPTELRELADALGPATLVMVEYPELPTKLGEAADEIERLTRERDAARRALRDAVLSLELLASHDPPWGDDHVRAGAVAEAIRNTCPWWQP